MPRMGKHSPTEAAGKRARVCAWLVFISMAGTTMSFQVYHSIEHGHMPWPLAVLYGIVPLFISMLVIEFASGRAQWVAYLLMGGAMYLSAAATGSVVLRAAPTHSSLLFGLILDGAAILAARFLMTAVKRGASAELAAAQSTLAGERSARLEAETELGSVRDELAKAVARTEALARKLAASGSGQGGNRKRKPAGSGSGNAGSGNSIPNQQPEEEIDEAPADLDSEAKVLWFLDKGFSASKAGVMAGLTDSRGRQIARLAREAPKGIDEGGSQ
jgi:hypothetical protein